MISLTGSGMINIADSSIIRVKATSSGTASVGGLNGEIQFNNGGVNDGITNVTTTGLNLKFGDLVNLYFGTDKDMFMSHDGTNSMIQNNTGELLFQNADISGNIHLQLGSNTSTTRVALQDSSFVNMTTVDGDGISSVTGNLTAMGAIRGGEVGSFLNAVSLTETEIGIPQIDINPLDTWTDIITYVYTPVAPSSRLMIHFDFPYFVNNPLGAFTFEGRITVNGTQIGLKQHVTRQANGGGDRSAVLSPFIAAYDNTDLTVKTIIYQIQWISGASTLSVLGSTGSFLSVYEIKD